MQQIALCESRTAAPAAKGWTKGIGQEASIEQRDAEAATSTSCVNAWASDLQGNTTFHHLLNGDFYESKKFKISTGDSFGFYEGNFQSRISKESEKVERSPKQIYYNFSENGRSVHDIHRHINIFLRKNVGKDIGIRKYLLEMKSLIRKYKESRLTEPLDFVRCASNDSFDTQNALKLIGLRFEAPDCRDYRWIGTPLKYLVNPRVPNRGRYDSKSEPASSPHRGRESWHRPSPTFGRKSPRRHPRTAAWVSRLRHRSTDPPHDGSMERDSLYLPLSEYHPMRRHYNVHVLYKPPFKSGHWSRDALDSGDSSGRMWNPPTSQVPTRVPPTPEPTVATHLRDAFGKNMTKIYLNHLLHGSGSDRSLLTQFTDESFLSSDATGIRSLVFHSHRLLSPLPDYPFHRFEVKFNDPLYGKYKKEFFQETEPNPSMSFFSFKGSPARSKKKKNNAIDKARREYGFYRSIPMENYFDERWPRNPHYQEDQSSRANTCNENTLQREYGSRASPRGECNYPPQYQRREQVCDPESPFRAYTQPVDDEEGETEYFTCVRVTKPLDIPKTFLRENVPESKSCPFFTGRDRMIPTEDDKAEQWRKEILERTRRDYAFYDKLDFSEYIDPAYPRNPNFQFSFPAWDNHLPKEIHSVKYEEQMEKMRTRDYVKENTEPGNIEPGKCVGDARVDNTEEEVVCPYQRAAIREQQDRASFSNCPYTSAHLSSGFGSKGMKSPSHNPSSEESFRDFIEPHVINNPLRNSEGPESTIAKEKITNQFQPTIPGHHLLKPLILDSTEDYNQKLEAMCPPSGTINEMDTDYVSSDDNIGENWENDDLIQFLMSDYYFEDRKEQSEHHSPKVDPYFKNEFDNVQNIYGKDGNWWIKNINFRPYSSRKNKSNKFWMFTEDGLQYICTRGSKFSPIL